MTELYSLENAKKFNWSSISGNLNAERVAHLKNYIVGEKILDAGCGGGAFVEFLCKKGLKVTGIDKHDEFLQVARQNSNSGSGTYIQSDITNLPFPDKSFDCTYCFDVLEHVDDQLALKELIRVTSTRLIIAVPKEDEVMQQFGLTFAHYQDKTHLRNYTHSSLKDLISDHNPSEINIFPELAVPLNRLISYHLDAVPSDYRDPNPLWDFMYKGFLRQSLARLLKKASINPVYTGLVAVINL